MDSTYFEDAKALRIERKFTQDAHGGVLIQFSISNHALGKIASTALYEALDNLLELVEEDKGENEQ